MFTIAARARPTCPRVAGALAPLLAFVRRRGASPAPCDTREFVPLLGATDDELARFAAGRTAKVLERARLDIHLALGNGRIR